MTITAAADGSALGNPGPAGWAWYIDEDTWRAGGWPHGTNNMGELKAVLDLLEATAVDADQHLVILCDSQYVINSVTKWMPGWKRKGWRKKDGKPVLNVELLQAIDRALAGRSVDFEWVKGHAGHAMNEAADERAHAAATAFSKGQDPAIGPGYRSSGPPAEPGALDPSPREQPTEDPATPAGDPAPPDGSSATPTFEFERPEDRPAGFTTAPPPEDLFSLFDDGDGRGAHADPGEMDPGETDPGDAETAPGACAPDLDTAADAVARVDALSTSVSRGAALGAAGSAEDAGVLEEVVARELVLLRDEIREDPPSAAALLHPDFTEIGASGRAYDRDEVLARLAPLPGVDAYDLVAEQIAPTVVLVRYSTAQEGQTVHRSSVWVHESGRWLLRHHQGTRA